MDFLQMLTTRRSVRTYSDEQLSMSDIEKILQAALLSPTSRSKKSWEFIVIKDSVRLKELAKCNIGAIRLLKNAMCAIVVVGNESKSDTWIEDCSIAMINMQLMAHSLNIGSCWIQGRSRHNDYETMEDHLQKCLNIPNNYRLEAILSLGKANREFPSHDMAKLDYQKIHNEYF